MAHSPHPFGGLLMTGLAAAGTLRWVAADLTQPLEEARCRLDLSPIAAVALGRSLAAAALIQRISLKVPARIVLEILGDGPLGRVVAESEVGGGLRGSIGSPQHPTPPDGELRLAALVGRGFLRVTREGRNGSRYASQVALVSGELGDDVTHYLEQSEQIRSAVLLGVLPRPVGVAAAGGLVVEALPGTDEEIIAELEQNIRGMEGVSSLLDRGGAGALVAAVLDDFDPEPIDRQDLEYRCPCSRATLLDRLLPIAREDPGALLAGSGECEAVCAFCGERHVFTAAELLAAG